MFEDIVKKTVPDASETDWEAGVISRIGVAPSWSKVTVWLDTPGPENTISDILESTDKFSL